MTATKATAAKRTTKKKSTRKPQVQEHPLSSENLFTNREIGWLNFNRRVLSEAEDSRNPLLERVKFLSISGSNLDEFFMKRVGGLKRQVAYGISPKSSDGKTPLQQLADVRHYVLPMIQDQAQCFMKMKPALKEQNIVLMTWAELNEAEKEQVTKYYNKNVFPVLTPLSVDPGHPFPFISNLSVSLGVTLKHPHNEEKLFARVKTPNSFVTLPELTQIIDKLKATPLRERVTKLQLRPDRADVILPAAMLIETILRQAEVSKIVIPSVGLRDGLIWSMI